MKYAILTALTSAVVAMAAPAPAPLPVPQQGPDAWFPDVWNCRCHSAEKDLPLIQPICSKFGGQDMTIYPPAEPHPYLGRFVWCSKTSLKSAQRANRMAAVFNDSACQAEFGAGFVAQCEVAGYDVCFGEEECH